MRTLVFFLKTSSFYSSYICESRVKFVPYWTLNCIIKIRASFCYCKTRCENLDRCYSCWNGDYLSLVKHARCNACERELCVNVDNISRSTRRKKVLRLPLARALAQLILNATNIKIRYTERERERQTCKGLR